MKIYVLILNIVITGATLYGSTIELPLAEMRESINNGDIINAAQDFVASSHEIINKSDDLITSVHALVDPLIENQQSNAAIIRTVLYFFILLIAELEEHYPQNQDITRLLANFTFDSVLYNGSVRNLPILNIAIISGYPDVAEQLLKIGSNANGFDLLTGVTPLMTAAEYGYDDDALDLVKMLLQYGANPSLKDKSGKTARDYALKAGDSKAAAYLYFVGRDAPDKSDFDKSDFNQEQHS